MDTRAADSFSVARRAWLFSPSKAATLNPSPRWSLYSVAGTKGSELPSLLQARRGEIRRSAGPAPSRARRGSSFTQSILLDALGNPLKAQTGRGLPFEARIFKRSPLLTSSRVSIKRTVTLENGLPVVRSGSPSHRGSPRTPRSHPKNLSPGGAPPSTPGPAQCRGASRPAKVKWSDPLEN